MIDLHAHTFFSDGVLSPSELVYRAKCRGYTAIALTDHIDYSNADFILPRMVKACEILSKSYGILAVAGAELTYVPPKLIKEFAAECRKLGAKIVVVHGETVSETVPAETNLYAVQAGIDILAHPGHLSLEAAELAAKNNVKIEITARKYHDTTNKEVAQTALKAGAKLVLNTDAHAPENLLTEETIEKILAQAGLPQDYYKVMQENAGEIIKAMKNEK